MIRHPRTDLRDLSDLMVQRVGVTGNVVQLPTAAAALRGVVILALVRLIGRHQRTVMARMAGLAPGPTLLLPATTLLSVSLLLLLRAVP